MLQCLKRGGDNLHFLARIINILDADMTTPTMYGWFHLLFIVLTIGGAVALCKCFKNPSHKTVKKILLVFSLVSIVLEIYKQINYTYSYDGTAITADYQWYAFPFQFCSTPMYIALLAAVIGHKKTHYALSAYLATFSLFAGVCVMVYPAQVFISTIGINIQTMICHGSMISVGAFLLASGYVKTEHKTVLYATPVFAVMVVIASVMNEIAFATGLLERETFNMFFISPYCEPSLPVYSWVQAVVPYPWCAIIYIVAFSLAAYIILLIVRAAKNIFSKNKAQEKTPVMV